MRAFIAIPLSEEAHRELARLQDRLRISGADVKWVQPHNIHLTLKFLGEIDEKQLEEVKTSLAEAIKSHKPFSISLSKVGTFPKPSYPRVVWVGIEQGKIECEELQKDVESAMQKLGFEKEERPFTAHLTLGRVRSPKGKSRLIENIEKEKDFALEGKVSVDKIILFQSTLTPQGPIYTPIKEFPFV